MCISINSCPCDAEGHCCSCCSSCKVMKPRTRFQVVNLRLMECIEQFHDRLPCELSSLRNRMDIIKSEIKECDLEVEALEDPEAADEEGYNRFLQEMADVVFLASGTLHLAGEAGIKAMNFTIKKNNAKDTTTHYKNPVDGKWIRKMEF